MKRVYLALTGLAAAFVLAIVTFDQHYQQRPACRRKQSLA
jgi:hypothetical protein